MTWKSIKLDETQHWRADVVDACGGKILSVYVFEDTRAVYCCELRPSYELWLSHYEPACAVSEATLDLLMEARSVVDSVHYVHVSAVDDRNLLTPSSDDETRVIEYATEIYEREVA